MGNLFGGWRMENIGLPEKIGMAIGAVVSIGVVWLMLYPIYKVVI